MPEVILAGGSGDDGHIPFDCSGDYITFGPVPSDETIYVKNTSSSDWASGGAEEEGVGCVAHYGHAIPVNNYLVVTFSGATGKTFYLGPKSPGGC